MTLLLCPNLSMPQPKSWQIAQLQQFALHSVSPVHAVTFSELDPNEFLSVTV